MTYCVSVAITCTWFHGFVDPDGTEECCNRYFWYVNLHWMRMSKEWSHFPLLWPQKGHLQWKQSLPTKEKKTSGQCTPVCRALHRWWRLRDWGSCYTFFLGISGTNIYFSVHKIVSSGQSRWIRENTSACHLHSVAPWQNKDCIILFIITLGDAFTRCGS